MQTKLKTLLRNLDKQFFLDVSSDRKTVFLAGTGRSGTTWAEEVINHRKDYRVLFEPFHNKRTPILKDWNYRQYIPPENSEDCYLVPAAKILRGHVKNYWIDRYNNKRIYRKRIIKDIRANLFLKWTHRHFPKIPIILLLRHPCAVASSKLALQWDTHLDEFLLQEQLVNDFLQPFVKEMQSAKEPFDKHIFLWCVENYIPLMQFQAHEIHVVFYEDLYLNPEKITFKLMDFIHEDYDPGILQQIRKPSALSRENSAIVTKSNVLEDWRNQITPVQIDRAVEILGLFGLDKIYAAGSTPLIQAEDACGLFSKK